MRLYAHSALVRTTSIQRGGRIVVIRVVLSMRCVNTLSLLDRQNIWHLFIYVCIFICAFCFASSAFFSFSTFSRQAFICSTYEIVLFETSLGHAGEHLDKILCKHSEGLPMPLTMSDALSSNKPTVMDVYRSLCNAHCRCQFVNLENHHPKDVEWVLDTYSIICDSEYKVKEQNLNADERLAYHKEHSLLAMEKLKNWAEEKINAATFEENSPLGKAINYLLKHYNNLIMFCKMVGVLIDNNRMDQTLKIIIRSRKASHFYKIVIGAQVANVLLSVIATAQTSSNTYWRYKKIK